MQLIKFKAKCPYEIGDKIKFEKPGNAYYKGETKNNGDNRHYNAD